MRSLAIDERNVRPLVGFAVLASFVAAIWLSLMPERLAASHLVYDDTFYYLNTAWNQRLTGVASFDGIHPTNGFQLGWYGVILVAAYIVPYKEALVPAAFLIGIAFSLASCGQILRISRTLSLPAFGLLTSLLWIGVSFTKPYTRGMESGIYTFALWWFLANWIKEYKKDEQPDWLRLCPPAILSIWCRLDAGFFILVFGTILLIQAAKRSNLNSKNLGLSISIMAASILLYGVMLHHIGNTYIPISGLVKTAHVTIKVQTPKVVFRLIRMFGIPRLGFQYVMPAVLILASGCLLVRMKSLESLARRLLVVTCIAALIHLAAQILILRNISYWYFGSMNIALTMVCGLALPLMVRTQTTKYIAALSISVLPFIVVNATRIGPQGPDNRLYDVRYTASKWIKSNLPPGAILSSYNTGQLGFYSGHRVVNLDGLMNTPEYLSNILSGREPLSVYFKQQHIDYIVDHMDPTVDRVTLGLPNLHTWPVKGKVLVVWDARGAEEKWHGGWFKTPHP